VSPVALVIQITPHHNGEVFLSKTAVNQNPGFFGFPFAGRTVPKKRGNTAYPQRVPDPIVNITIFDGAGARIVSKAGFNLNTVFYEKKAEIRITFSADLTGAVEQFAIMVMRQGTGISDYEIEIYNPGSPFYDQYLAVCNQLLPSGGPRRARRMGWL